MDSGQACRPCRGSFSPIPGRDCFGDLPGDEIVVSPPSPIVEQLMEDTRPPKCVMFGEMMGGAGSVGGQEKEEWMKCFLDDLRAFGINADQWTTAAQDEGEWRRTAELGAEHFMAKWIVAEKPRLDHGIQWCARM